MPEEQLTDYTKRSRFQSRLATYLIVGLFLLTIAVFAILHTAGTFIAGS